MQDEKELQGEELYEALLGISTAMLQHLQEAIEKKGDPYDIYLLERMVKLLKRFDDFPHALLKGHQFLMDELKNQEPQEKNNKPQEDA